MGVSVVSARPSKDLIVVVIVVVVVVIVIVIVIVVVVVVIVVVVVVFIGIVCFLCLSPERGRSLNSDDRGYRHARDALLVVCAE